MYAGCYLADSAEAIARLEKMWARGRILVFLRHRLVVAGEV